MMTKRQLGKVCRDAADVILRDGFCKGDFGSTDGPKCALGALRVARHGTIFQPLDLEDGDLDTLFVETRPRARKYVDVVAFNDAPRTRKHDVVQVLRDMAAAAGA